MNTTSHMLVDAWLIQKHIEQKKKYQEYTLNEYSFS